MDIRCKHCGEPWAVDCLHDVYDQDGNKRSFEKAYRHFRKFGCPAMDGDLFMCEAGKVVDQAGLDAIGTIQEMLRDDVDGCASMTDDFFQ